MAEVCVWFPLREDGSNVGLIHSSFFWSSLPLLWLWWSTPLLYIMEFSSRNHWWDFGLLLQQYLCNVSLIILHTVVLSSYSYHHNCHPILIIIVKWCFTITSLCMSVWWTLHSVGVFYCCYDYGEILLYFT